MLLTYSKEKFKGNILKGAKIHSLREDKGKRWKEGMLINHWLYSPRNKKHKPAHEFLKNECVSVQEIEICRAGQTDIGLFIKVDGDYLINEDILELVKNDGLELKQFRMWFLPSGIDIWEGRIIHWTNKKYIGLPF